MKLNLKKNKFLQQTANIINEKIMIYLGEEFWGDLWEEYYKLIKQQRPKIIVQFITALNYLQFLWASHKISCQKVKQIDLQDNTIYKSKFQLVKKTKLPIITFLFMFFFVIFSDSNASNLISDSNTNIPANTSKKFLPKYSKRNKSTVQAATPKSLRQKAEKNQLEAQSEQLKAEKNQLEAQKQQLAAEKKQRIAGINKSETEAKKWYNKAYKKRIEAQNWLKIADEYRRKSEFWLRVAQKVKE